VRTFSNILPHATKLEAANFFSPSTKVIQL